MLPAFCRRHDPDLGLHDPDLGCRCRDKTDDLALSVKVLVYGKGCMKVDVTSAVEVEWWRQSGTVPAYIADINYSLHGKQGTQAIMPGSP